ncbi:low affinity iron permease family protein [Pedobacter yulinensis]|uniref:Low affinity iron permease family protein n=1 Tax=Pedobacter yulinensis TaxID=2126353 RepID=A0A2T3HK55_9SPHI|nr:low affinity iron permease family protein [Pedobacter yulinensis]PST82816.1 low affinity iron permease family protein [Pedobacter yulinensis]
MKKRSIFESLANKITTLAGSPPAFTIALLIVLAWGISGPIFKYSDTWQLVINTGTTIVTFLMVFLIQKTQNKDAKAIQLKLNELVAASRYASNRMVDIEDLSEEELDVLHKYYKKLSDEAEEDDDIHKSHSIDAAEQVQEVKNARNDALQKKEPDAERKRPGPTAER